MKTYILTSPKIDGFVLFEFDQDGFLVRYDTSQARLTEDQKIWILKKLPKSIGRLKTVLKDSRVAKLELQLTKDVTFQQFWDRYNHKTRSSKKKTQTIWNRMSQVQRDRAYNFINQYERSLPGGIAKKYAETYLNAELWNN